MFTGIISAIGTLESATQQGDLRIAVECPWPADAVTIGESIALSGVCLTVVEKAAHNKGSLLHFTLSSETVSLTAPRWQKGSRVNLERALKIGDALGGHLVSGHVDGLAKLISITQEGDSHVMGLEAPAQLLRFIAAKGSVVLDGVSLTVNRVEKTRFFVNIIPHSWQETTLGERQPGDALNLEIDLIARYVERLMQKP